MSTHSYYILVNLACFIVPFIFSFHPKLKFYLKWKEFFIGALVMMAVFIPWDAYFTSQGIWGFNTKYTTGYFLGNLPIEEWFFFICIPYACLFTYHCIGVLVKKIPFGFIMKALAWLFAIVSLLIAVLYYKRWYSFTAHLLCGMFLLVHLLWLKSRYLSRFIFVFILILPFFLASNGVLTGVDFWNYPFINTNPEGINEKIVWYNNSHNLGLRLFTMPVDDLAYGITMLLVCVTLFEGLKKQNPDVTQGLPKS
jgi:lycopene cyclase domain-containing protein